MQLSGREARRVHQDHIEGDGSGRRDSDAEALPPCMIAFDLCRGAPLERALAKLGHEVRPMPAKVVKACLKRNKSDAADAALSVMPGTMAGEWYAMPAAATCDKVRHPFFMSRHTPI
jgi:transposase